MQENQPAFESIRLSDAYKQMKHLSSCNVPFSFAFVSLDQSKRNSKGLVFVDSALLRKSMRKESSAYYGILVEYTQYKQLEDKDRHFYLPLLVMFNGKIVTNEHLRIKR